MTSYALVGDDIRLTAFSKSSDFIFYIFSTIVLTFYIFELTASFILKPDYRWSSYFLLDIISTFSLIPDIGWV